MAAQSYGVRGEAGDEVLAVLNAFGDALDGEGDPLDALPDSARDAGAAVVHEVRVFEARVGQRTGIAAKRVGGPLIELGDRDRHRFETRHGHAAERVAHVLADLMIALGAAHVRPVAD